MSKDEFIEQLSKWRQRLDKDVINLFRAGQADRGNMAFDRWRSRFTEFLDDNLPSEAAEFRQKISSHARVSRSNEPPINKFLRNYGSRCVAFIDDLVDAVNKGYVSIETSPKRLDKLTMKEEDTSTLSGRDRRKVFVVHGRNSKIRMGMDTFLRSIDLQPIEWAEMVRATGKATPHPTEVLTAGFSIAQAIVILFTPDDEARLRSQFVADNDPNFERELLPQARQNVILEAGMALAMFPERTLIVEFGQTRPISDISGLHTVRMDNSVGRRQDVAERLETAGCAVNITGRREWHTAGDLTLDDDGPTQTQNDSPPSKIEFSEGELKLLRVLNEIPETEDGPTAESLAQYLSMEVGRVHYQLDRLEENDLVGYVLDSRIGAQYFIKKSGRRILYGA